MDYDRCPECSGPMTFEGIDARKFWTRWTSCAIDGTWVVSNEHGDVLEVSKSGPAKGQFLTGRALGRNE